MTYRLTVIAATLAAALLLGGCHTVKALLPPNLRPPSKDTGDNLKLARQELAQATPCCSSFADFSYSSLLPWHPQKFTLGVGSTVANLNGTHSYFLAFRLPDHVKIPYRVALKSVLNGRWLQSSYLFAPSVVLLDEAFQPLRSEDIGLCEHVGWSDDTTGAFGQFKVDNKKARYLLIYSSAKQQTGKTYWEQSPATFTTNATTTLQMNSSGSFGVAHGPDGSLWVGKMDDTYAKALDNAVCSKPAQGDGILSGLRSAVLGSSGNHATDRGSS